MHRFRILCYPNLYKDRPPPASRPHPPSIIHNHPLAPKIAQAQLSDIACVLSLITPGPPLKKTRSTISPHLLRLNTNRIWTVLNQHLITTSTRDPLASFTRTFSLQPQPLSIAHRHRHHTHTHTHIHHTHTPHTRTNIHHDEPSQPSRTPKLRLPPLPPASKDTDADLRRHPLKQHPQTHRLRTCAEAADSDAAEPTGAAKEVQGR